MANLIANGVRALVRRRQESLRISHASDVRALLGGDAIALLDVGASGGIIPRWRPYRESIAFTGVEPDQRSIPALLNSPEAKVFKSYDIIPSGAWNRNGAVSISFTRKPMCSSHFAPNIPFLSRFPEVERFDIVGSIEVECRTIDDLLAGRDKSIDFIKLDLEGGELAVLEGAGSTIESCMGLHVEVSFQSIRNSQPLFGDVSNFLQKFGIDFIDFVSLFRWERKSFNGLGQAIFADALFLRGPESLIELAGGNFLTAGKARTYLAILLIYERFDLASRFLDLLEAGNVFFNRGDIEGFAAIVKRRKAIFDRRYRFVSMLGRTLSRYAGENYGLHYIY
jgi:FkbM family methyltransferase